MNTFKVPSPTGTYTAESVTGSVLHTERDDTYACPSVNIVRFNIDEYLTYYGHPNDTLLEGVIDILDIGYWYVDKTGCKDYMPPAQDLRSLYDTARALRKRSDKLLKHT